MTQGLHPRSGGLAAAVSSIATWTLALVTIVLLVGCHALINPADPNSVTYTGITDPTGGGDDPEPEPVMPLTAKWELATDHQSGGTLLPLEITADGRFVEPRESGWFELRITFENSFEGDQADGMTLWIAGTDVSGWTSYDMRGDYDRRPEYRQIRVFFGGVPNEMRFRMKLTDRNGVSLGERLFGRLIADVNGNGLVEVSGDHAAITDVEGYPVSPENPATLRADIDVDGQIEAGGGDDWNRVSINVGRSLPSTVPDLW